MTRIYVLITALALGGVACAHQPRSYSFAVNQPKEAIDVLVKTLASNGLSKVDVDRDKGTVTTRWFDTGYKFRELSETDDGPNREYSTDVFLRYRISVGQQAGRQTVTLQTDVQRCSPLDAVITPTGVEGSCVPMSVLLPSHQKQSDALGAKLQSALNGDAG
jgi:hypothetical protein